MRGAAAVLAFAQVLAPLLAGDDDPPPPKPFPVARKEYEAAAQANEAKKLAAALGQLARSGLISDDKRDKTYAKGALKRCLKNKATEVRVAAARGFGVLRLKGSSRDLRGILNQAVQGRQPAAVGAAVIEAWGRIHDRGSHGDLLAIVKKPSADKAKLQLAQAAARVLGRYRALAPKERAKVMEDLMSAFGQLYTSSHRRAKETEIKWWEALEKEMVAAFNALASTHLGDYYECYDWWEANRRKVKEGR